MKKKRDKEVATGVSQVLKSSNPPSAPKKNKRKRKPAAEESASDDEDDGGIEINNQVDDIPEPPPPPIKSYIEVDVPDRVFFTVKSLPMKTTVLCSCGRKMEK